MRREEVGVIAGRIKNGLVERLGVEVDCSWNDEVRVYDLKSKLEIEDYYEIA